MLNRLWAGAVQQHLGTKLTCLLGLSCYWFLSTYGYRPENFSPADLRNVVPLLVLVLLVQAVFVCGLAHLLKSGNNVLLGLFSTVNLFSLYLNFVGVFIRLEVHWQLLAMVVAWWVASMSYFFLDGNRGLRVGALALTAVLLLFSAGRAYIKSLPPMVVPARDNGEFTSSPNVKLVDFTHKPNVYFLSFDGMMAGSLGRKLRDIESLPYVQVLQEHGFTKLANHFSDGPATKTSLNKLLALDPDYFFRHHQSNHPLIKLLALDPELFLQRQQRNRSLVSGHTPAPLLEIFQANGYTTNLFVADGYLGIAKGPYVDKYKILGDLTLCSFLESGVGFAFFGYCSLSQDVLKRESFDHTQVFLDEVGKLLRGAQPFFAFTYIYLPGHFNLIFAERAEQVVEFREDYVRNSASAGVAIDRWVKFIRENDPGAIMFVFGDHGPTLTEDWHAGAREEGRDLRLHIHDRLGVHAAYSVPMHCPALAQPGSFSLTSQVALRIVQCLAGGEDPVVNALHYRLRQQDYAWDGQDHEYSEFLYE